METGGAQRAALCASVRIKAIGPRPAAMGPPPGLEVDEVYDRCGASAAARRVIARDQLALPSASDHRESARKGAARRLLETGAPGAAIPRAPRACPPSKNGAAASSGSWWIGLGGDAAPSRGGLRPACRQARPGGTHGQLGLEARSTPVRGGLLRAIPVCSHPGRQEDNIDHERSAGAADQFIDVKVIVDGSGPRRPGRGPVSTRPSSSTAADPQAGGGVFATQSESPEPPSLRCTFSKTVRRAALEVFPPRRIPVNGWRCRCSQAAGERLPQRRPLLPAAGCRPAPRSVAGCEIRIPRLQAARRLRGRFRPESRGPSLADVLAAR